RHDFIILSGRSPSRLGDDVSEPARDRAAFARRLPLLEILLSLFPPGHRDYVRVPALPLGRAEQPRSDMLDHSLQAFVRNVFAVLTAHRLIDMPHNRINRYLVACLAALRFESMSEAIEVSSSAIDAEPVK